MTDSTIIIDNMDGKMIRKRRRIVATNPQVGVVVGNRDSWSDKRVIEERKWEKEAIQTRRTRKFQIVRNTIEGVTIMRRIKRIKIQFEIKPCV